MKKTIMTAQVNGAAAVKSEGGGVRDTTQDVMKGILIVLIVVGHNRLLTASVKDLFYLLYFWHVQAFFFVAYAERQSTGRFLTLQTLIVRYMTPFVLICGALTICKYVVLGETDILKSFLVGALTGYAPSIKKACGFYLYWFLPTFVSFNFLALWISQRGIKGALAIFAVIAIYLLAVLLPYNFSVRVGEILPLGFFLAGYLMPSAWLYASLLAAMKRGRSARIVVSVSSAIVVAIAVSAVLRGGMHVNISMYLLALQPFEAVFATVASVSACLLLRQIAYFLSAVRGLAVLGQRSMIIFIFHQIIQSVLILSVERTYAALGYSSQVKTLAIAVGALVAFLAIIGALKIGALLDQMPRIKDFVFPADVRTLCKALKAWPCLKLNSRRT